MWNELYHSSFLTNSLAENFNSPVRKQVKQLSIIPTFKGNQSYYTESLNSGVEFYMNATIFILV